MKLKSPFFCYFYGVLLSSCAFFFGLGVGTFTTFFKFFISNFGELSKEEKDSIQGNIGLYYIFGGTLACITGSFIYEKIGRYRSLIFMLTVEIIVISAMFYKSIKFLYFLRVISGYISCFWTLLIPNMIRECLPSHIADRFNALFGAFLTGGICISYCFGFEWAREKWRWVLMWPLLLEVPKLFAFIFVFKMESPVWMIENGASEIELSRNYEYFYNKHDASILANEMMRKAVESVQIKIDWKEIFSRKYSIQIMLAVVLNILNQLTGINFFCFYSNDIYEKAGFKNPTPVSISASLVSFFSSLLLILTVKYFSKKTIMINGLFGQVTSHLILIVGLLYNIKLLLLLGPFLYMFTYSHSVGGILYPYCADIVPPKAFSLCILAQWILSCITVKLAPYLMETYGLANVFFFFQSCSFLGTLFVIGYAESTENLSQVEIINKYAKKKFFD